MKYVLTFVLLLSVMAFAADHKDQGKMNQAGKMACELNDGEACTAIALPTAHCTCGGTEKAIGEALNSVEGVTMVKVDVKKNMAHVHYTKGDVKVADLEKAVATAGFDANDTKADAKAQAKLHKCCQPK